ncbi:MAG: ABC transporter permease [Bacteroidetes bacterium]|nr:MAG: ABC transporter permease [Bacteroidota bacterium]
MLFKISWRNIWRNPTRSFVVIGAIIVGVWSVIFLASMAAGMMDSYVDNAINNEISHIQIHHPEFTKEKEAKFFLEDMDQLLEKTVNVEGVTAASARSMTNAMIASGKSTRGIRVAGIMPELEEKVTGISEKMIEGDYLNGKGKNPILVSKVIAEKLKLKMRSKVVLTMQDLDGDITAGAFRVAGIFESGNNMYDETITFVRYKDLNRILGKENVGHEIAIKVDNLQVLDTTQVLLANALPDQSVQSYKEIAPELELFQTQIRMAAQIYMFIFMLALIFGIINTMLMTVLERVKELGMLMSVGMNKFKVFSMIMLETLMLAVISAPIGLGLGYFTTNYFNKNGINLAGFSEEGMKQFGMSTFIYPSVEPSIYLDLAIAVAITAIIASIYPALKAIRLRPVEAIRKI